MKTRAKAELEREFTRKLLGNIREVEKAMKKKDLKYKPIRWRQMISVHGALEAVRRMNSKDQVDGDVDGGYFLYSLGLARLTYEGEVILHPKRHPLFEEWQVERMERTFAEWRTRLSLEPQP